MTDLERIFDLVQRLAAAERERDLANALHEEASRQRDECAAEVDRQRLVIAALREALTIIDKGCDDADEDPYVRGDDTVRWVCREALRLSEGK